MIERLKALKVDDALKEGTEIGPVVDQTQLDQDLKYLDVGQKEGARLAFGGERLEREPQGLLLSPGPLHRIRPTPCGSTARRSSGRWPA